MNASVPERLSRLVVLISGNGSNLQAILDACTNGTLNARVAAVFSNKADAFGLQRAAAAGVPALVHQKLRDMERAVYDARLAEAVASYSTDWVVLAGWMRILSSAFLDRFPGRVINLHPALPGMFPGTHAIERAYQAYQAGEITFEARDFLDHLRRDKRVFAFGHKENSFNLGGQLVVNGSIRHLIFEISYVPDSANDVVDAPCFAKINQQAFK